MHQTIKPTCCYKKRRETVVEVRTCQTNEPRHRHPYRLEPMSTKPPNGGDGVNPKTNKHASGCASIESGRCEIIIMPACVPCHMSELRRGIHISLFTVALSLSPGKLSSTRRTSLQRLVIEVIESKGAGFSTENTFCLPNEACASIKWEARSLGFATGFRNNS